MELNILERRMLKIDRLFSKKTLAAVRRQKSANKYILNFENRNKAADEHCETVTRYAIQGVGIFHLEL